MTSPAVTFLTHIIKRDGTIKPFDPNKILSTLLRAGAATGEFGHDEAEALMLQAAIRRVQLKGETAPHIDQIRDVVENVLFDAGYRKTLRAYIVYHEQRKGTRSGRKSRADAGSSSNEYPGQSRNANHARSGRG